MKNIHRILAMALILVMALTSLTFASAEGAEKVLNIATVSGAGDLDPAGIAIDMWTEYAKLCVDPLIRFDAEGNVVFFIQPGEIAGEIAGVLTYPFAPAELLSAVNEL